MLFAFVEHGEAVDDWKKGRKIIGPDKKFKTLPEWEAGVAEELVDAIFYVLDGSRCMFPKVNMDEIFEKKWAKNMGRPYRYGEGYRNPSGYVSATRMHKQEHHINE